MHFTLHERFYRYETTSDYLNGLFQSHLNEISSFIELKPSSIDSNYNDPSIIFKNDNNFWQTNGESDSNLILTFSHHLLRLTQFALKSCVDYNCIYHFNIYGSNDLKNYENVCEINVDSNYFRYSPKNATCKSNAPYKSYQIKLTHGNLNDEWIMPIYYLEFFGDLYKTFPDIMSINETIFPFNFSTFLSLFIFCS